MFLLSFHHSSLILHTTWKLCRVFSSLNLMQFTYKAQITLLTGPCYLSNRTILFPGGCYISSDMLLRYIDTSYSRTTHLVLQILFLLCGIFFHGKSTFLIWKHKVSKSDGKNTNKIDKVLHPNMILIYNNLYFTFHIGSLGRIGLIIFESRLIKLQCMCAHLSIKKALSSDLGSFPVPQLAIIRMFSIAQAFGYIYFATTERFSIRALVRKSEINGRSEFLRLFL